jgi:hypothetical protein
MTFDQQNKAILELLGWKRIGKFEGVHPGYAKSFEETGEAILSPLPNALQDLNLMFEAEKLLTDEEWKDYIEYLAAFSHSIFREQQIVRASAIQKAEAFLKAKKLWKE